MPKRVLFAVARRDLLALIQQQDIIADTAEKIGQIVTQRVMEVSESIEEHLRSLCQVLPQRDRLLRLFGLPTVSHSSPLVTE